MAHIELMSAGTAGENRPAGRASSSVRDTTKIRSGIVMESVAQDLSPHNIRVSDVMISKPLITTESEDLECLLPRMCAAGVRRAPVVSNTGALLGIVSFDNFLQSIGSVLNSMAGTTIKQREIERRSRG